MTKMYVIKNTNTNRNGFWPNRDVPWWLRGDYLCSTDLDTSNDMVEGLFLKHNVAHRKCDNLNEVFNSGRIFADWSEPSNARETRPKFVVIEVEVTINEITKDETSN